MTNIFLLFNNLNKKLAETYAEENLIGERVVFLNLRKNIALSKIFPDFFIDDEKIKFGRFNNIVLAILSIFYIKVFALKKLDSFIMNLSQGEDFKIYVPHIYSPLIRAITGHHKCVGVLVVEEGDAAYMLDRTYDPTELDKIFSNRWVRLTLEVLKLIKRMDNRGFFPKECQVEGAICLSDDAFPFYEHKNVVSPNKVFKNDRSLAFKYGDLVSIILIDPLVQLGRITYFGYLDALRKFLASKSNVVGDGVVLLSFHPSVRCELDFKKAVENIFTSEGITYELYCGDVESLMVSVDGCRVFGLVSSSMRYAQACGCEIYTWLNFLGKEELNNNANLIEYHNGFKTKCLSD